MLLNHNPFVTINIHINNYVCYPLLVTLYKIFSVKLLLLPNINVFLLGMWSIPLLYSKLSLTCTAGVSLNLPRWFVSTGPALPNKGFYQLEEVEESSSMRGKFWSPSLIKLRGSLVWIRVKESCNGSSYCLTAPHTRMIL